MNESPPYPTTAPSTRAPWAHIALGLLGGLFGGLSSTAAAAQGIQKFKFEIQTLGGRKLTQEDFKNNVLLLDFWGTWCGPCKQAVPGLVKLYSRYKHHGLEIVGLNYREKGSKAEVLATIRAFAAANKITYPLAIGNKKIQSQVIGFAGYPTMLFFNKGLEFDRLETGFNPAKLAETEKWIRRALGIDGKGKGDGSETEETAEEEDATTIAKGVVSRPGNHDQGFTFTVKDLLGKEVKFSDYRGKRVVLALTSTWDHEAVNTVAILNKVHHNWAAKGIAVIAASLEMKAGFADKVAAIKAFVGEHKPSYTVLPVGLSFLKKVHRPEGIPLFLVFDAEGTLILRQRSASSARVLKAIDTVLASKALRVPGTERKRVVRRPLSWRGG